MLESEKILTVFVKDSTREANLYSTRKIEINKWFHLVTTYDYNHCSLYINGNLESRMPKEFDTKFLATDSVMLGHTANKKNSRYFIGAIDDIEFYDRVLTPQEIWELYRAPNPNQKKVILNWVLAGLALITVIILIYFIVKYQIKKGIVREKQKMELSNKLLETELRVNRALMNPHFVFNSLNSLQDFILSKDYLQANEYLIKFSKLMRRILESNMSNTISLEMEIELIERYLEIENLRFNKEIKYSVIMDPGISSSLTIPVMMLQPFIENAVWHGLLKKSGDKEIKISFSGVEGKYVSCIIEDNGSGRKTASKDHPEKKSLAILFVVQRLELLNRIYGLNGSLAIEDKPEAGGTIVKLLLPILKK